MTRAAIVGRNLRTYENMDVVYASLADDPTGQQVLVSLWRRHAVKRSHSAWFDCLMPPLVSIASS